MYVYLGSGERFKTNKNLNLLPNYSLLIGSYLKNIFDNAIIFPSLTVKLESSRKLAHFSQAFR